MSGPVMAGGVALPSLTEAVAALKAALPDYDVTTAGDVTALHTEVAVAFNRLDANTVSSMDPNALLMAAGVIRSLMDIEDVTWSAVNDSLASNPLTVGDEERDVTRTEYLFRDGMMSDFGQGSDITTKTLHEVKSWLVTGVRNRRIISDLDLDLTMTRDIISAASVYIDAKALTKNLPSAIHEDPVFSIGVLSFPNDRVYYFTLYRITVKAWLDTRRELFDEVDTHGLTVTVESRDYLPQMYVMRALEPETRDRALPIAVDVYERVLASKTSGGKAPELDKQNSKWPTISTSTGVIPQLPSALKASHQALSTYDLDLTPNVPQHTNTAVTGSTKSAIQGTCNGVAALSVSASPSKISDSAASDDDASQRPVPLSVPMSVVFGDTSPESVERISDDTFIVVACVNRFLRQAEAVTYDDVRVAIETNRMFVKNREDVFMGYDRLDKDGHNIHCLTNGTPSPSVRLELSLWLSKLINDDDFLTAFDLDIDALVSVLEVTCRHHDVIGDNYGEQEYFTREVVDLAFLRFPDESGEHFQLAKLKISAFSDCRRTEANLDLDNTMENIQALPICNIGASETSDTASSNSNEVCETNGEISESEPQTLDELKEMDNCGFIGEFHSTNFYPRLEVTRMLSEKVRKIAVRQGSAVYGLVRD